MEAWRLAGVAVIWLTSLAIVIVWVQGGGIQTTLGGGSDALTSLGRIAGLVASNLLLYQVLLMSRLPLFEKAFGHDALTRAHRLTGFWSFWLMFLHILLVVVGYAGTAGEGPVAQLVDMIVNYPGMLLATAGTFALILVVVTSLRRVRRRTRYESWHLLHLYAYLGVGLALPHQLWTGADFLSSPLATAYWWTLWGLAIASVLIFRLGVPLARSMRYGIRVDTVIPDGSSGVTVRMTGRRLDLVGARAGQFFVWRFMDGPGWSRGHPLSLSSVPRSNSLTITARIVGDGTARMARLKPGTRVLIEGPYGHLVGERRKGSKLLMIGSGAGVAPLVSLLQEQPYAPGDATLITRDSRPETALATREIAELKRMRGIRHLRLDGPRTHVSSTWLPQSAERWSGPAHISQLVPDLAVYDIYLCGPVPWMDAVRADLAELGVDAERVHFEAFTI